MKIKIFILTLLCAVPSPLLQASQPNITESSKTIEKTQNTLASLVLTLATDTSTSSLTDDEASSEDDATTQKISTCGTHGRVTKRSQHHRHSSYSKKSNYCITLGSKQQATALKNALQKLKLGKNSAQQASEDLQPAPTPLITTPSTTQGNIFH